MGEIKKINVYVGNVGQAYVDKETARQLLEEAEKNVQDVQEIIAAANELKTVVETALADAEQAKTTAEQVKNFLDQKIVEKKGNDNIVELLTALRINLQDNDEDGNPLNGGNINTADKNIEAISSLLDELDEILTRANKLLTEDQAYVEECQEAYDNAVEVFNALVPDHEEESQADKSDKEEAELWNMIHEVEDAIDTAISTTEAINATSEETQAAAEEILNDEGGEEPQDPTYTIRFMDGEEEIKTVTGVTGTEVELPEGLEKEGYNFKGWTVDGAHVILPVTNIGEEDITYLAVWSEAQGGGEEPGEPTNNNYFLGVSNKISFDESDLNEYKAERPTSITAAATSGNEFTAWIYPAEWGRPLTAISSLTNRDQRSAFNYDDFEQLPTGYDGMWIQSQSECTFELTW